MTEADDTPLLYRQWAGISLVAGALERRVWVRSGSHGGEPRLTYPHLFTFLVGAPAVGKSIITVVRELWRSTWEPGVKKPALHVADSNMTKASMVDSLADATRSFTPPSGPLYEYRCLLVAAEEFGVFLPNYDSNFIAVLNEIYNANQFYSEKRRYGPAKDVTVEYPLLNILGGLQPVWMNSTFPKEAWGMGLFSRTIMVYAASGPPIDLFTENIVRDVSLKRLRESLRRLSVLYGQLSWTDEAKLYINKWHLAGGPPTPTHSRLEHYVKRRTQHVIKLSMISSVSRTGAVGVIEKLDVERAIKWILEAEVVMPDIFRSMIGQSDHEVIEELYHFAVKIFAMTKKPIPDQQLTRFLLQRVPADKAQKILEMAERANVLSRVGGSDNYIPKNKMDFAE